jgi:hypothetical protein
MLEGLDEVDWQRLTHAYGPVADVPGQIRALVSPFQAVWEPAIDELFGNIYHQGTVYRATAFAVPFLVELLDYPEVACRGWILILLGSIARGTNLSRKPGPYPVEYRPSAAAIESERLQLEQE